MMTWFAAHSIVASRRVDSQGVISVYENIFLVEAPDAASASSKAAEMARREVDSDDSLTIDEAPAIRTFCGVRKVVAVSNPYPLDLDEDTPISGTELTYSKFEVSSEEDLQILVEGGELSLRYVE